MITQAVPLLMGTKIRQGQTDHKILATMRYREWIASGVDEVVACTRRDLSGDPIGLSLIARSGRDVEVDELGLAVDAPDRHLRYAELLFHAPLRYALHHGCNRLVLGLGSSEPKKYGGLDGLD